MITGTYNYVANPSTTRMTNLQNVYLECDTTTGQVIINLPPIADFNGFNNVKLFVSDKMGNASVNNIKIVAHASNKIDGGPQVVIDQNNGSAEVQISNSTNWIAEEAINPPSGETPFAVEIITAPLD